MRKRNWPQPTKHKLGHVSSHCRFWRPPNNASSRSPAPPGLRAGSIQRAGAKGTQRNLLGEVRGEHQTTRARCRQEGVVDASSAPCFLLPHHAATPCCHPMLPPLICCKPMLPPHAATPARVGRKLLPGGASTPLVAAGGRHQLPPSCCRGRRQLPSVAGHDDAIAASTRHALQPSWSDGGADDAART